MAELNTYIIPTIGRLSLEPMCIRHSIKSAYSSTSYLVEIHTAIQYQIFDNQHTYTVETHAAASCSPAMNAVTHYTRSVLTKNNLTITKR